MTVDDLADLYIAGHWRPSRSGACTTVVNPTTEEPIARVADGNAADGDAAVRAASAAAGAWARTPAGERCALVGRLADEMWDGRSGKHAAAGCVEFGLEGIAEYLTFTSIHRPA